MLPGKQEHNSKRGSLLCTCGEEAGEKLVPVVILASSNSLLSPPTHSACVNLENDFKKGIKILPRFTQNPKLLRLRPIQSYRQRCDQRWRPLEGNLLQVSPCHFGPTLNLLAHTVANFIGAGLVWLGSAEQSISRLCVHI